MAILKRSVVTKHLKDLEIYGRIVHHIGLPIHWNMKALNGKGNLGQKMLFWTLNLAMVTLLVTGIIMWRQYFSHYFSIPVLRIAILLHSASAFMLFTGILVHIYGILG